MGDFQKCGFLAPSRTYQKPRRAREVQCGGRRSGCNKPPRACGEAPLHLRESGNSGIVCRSVSAGSEAFLKPTALGHPITLVLTCRVHESMHFNHKSPKACQVAGRAYPVCTGQLWWVFGASPYPGDTGGPSWGLPPTTAALVLSACVACIPVCFWSFLNPCSLSSRLLLSSPEWAPATAFSVA